MNITINIFWAILIGLSPFICLWIGYNLNKIVDFFSWDVGNWWGSDKDIKSMWRNLWN